MSESHASNVAAAISAAWAPSTRTLYNRGIARFFSWCEASSIPASPPFDESVLCAFAASSLGLRSGAAVRNDMAGIRAWHILNNLAYCGGTRLDYVLRGISNLAPRPICPPRRRALREIHIVALQLHLSPTDGMDVATLAIAACAFWGQARLGELLPKRATLPAPLVPTIRDLSPSASRLGSRSLHLPWTKTARSRGEDIAICRQLGAADPIAALENHLTFNELSGDPELPLACYRSPAGSLSILSKTSFLNRCNGILGPLGFGRFTGHCFRIGGTTELLLRGVPPDVVRVMGRWASDSFLRYWRDAGQIAAFHAELINDEFPVGHRSGVAALLAAGGSPATAQQIGVGATAQPLPLPNLRLNQ